MLGEHTYRGGRERAAGKHCQPGATGGPLAERVACKRGRKDILQSWKVRRGSGLALGIRVEYTLPGSVGRLQVNGLLLLSGPNCSSSLLCRA